MSYIKGFSGQLFRHYRLDEYGFGFINSIIIMDHSGDIMDYEEEIFERIICRTIIEKEKVKESFLNILELCREYDFIDEYLEKESLIYKFNDLKI